MTDQSTTVQAGAPARHKIRSRLFLKYAALFVAVVCVALVTNGLFEIWVSYRQHKDALIQVQHEQAESAATKIGQFIKEIESQVGWTTQLLWSVETIEQRRFDALRLLRQVPAITELSQVDASGKEQLRVSRLAMDVVGSGLDLSKEPKFAEAVKNKVYYGPVYFRRESEPYMTLSLAGTRRDAGVSIAEVNLKLIWDVVSKIKVGEHGQAYVVDARGRLIAHPDISLVLRNTDMTRLAQIQAAQRGASGASAEEIQTATDIQGRQVLTAFAPVAPLGWTVFVELPVEEAYQPLFASMQRSLLVLFAALCLAALAGIFLARRMVVPIQALRTGAARLGGGDLSQRISVNTGDELEALADQFNDMAGRLQESYTGLEKKVEVRTQALTEALEQQTATSEVLKVISSSRGELQPVFETMLANAVRICQANFGVLFRFEDGAAHAIAMFGVPPAFADFWESGPKRFGPGTAFARVAETKQVVHVIDVKEEPAYIEGEPILVAAVSLGGFRTLVNVPMLKENELIGTIAIYRQEVRAFTEKQIELVTNFAAQAVIAIENTRLLHELQARTGELAQSVGELRALGEVSQAVNSTVDLETVLTTIVAKATQLSSTEAGAIYVFDDAAQEFRLRATHGLDDSAVAEIRDRHIRIGETAIGEAALRRVPIQIADIQNDPSTTLDIIVRAGFRALLIVPLFSADQIVGALVVRRRQPGEFSKGTIELLQTFGAQSVLAIQNAKLFESVEARTRELGSSLDELRTAQDRLVQTEKLASLGQLTAGIAHEIKNPLNFVNNFSSVSVELIDELRQALAAAKLDNKLQVEIGEIADMLQGNLDKVVQHGKRADSIVKNMLLHSRQGSGEHRPMDINTIVEESLNLAYHGARAEKQGFNITLQRSFDPGAGEVDLFPQEITRVLLNLISNGFYAATKRKTEENGADYEPVLAAVTKDLGDRVEIRIRDNGTGIPPEVKERMFNPFFTTKPAGEGTGLGLSISHDIIVKQHRGSIEVDTQPGEFTEFKIILPRSAASLAASGGRA
ncbi:MAG: GAF domain-containing protein [Pseudolabrys sp.]|jgi:signal transduction histidine kinase